MSAEPTSGTLQSEYGDPRTVEVTEADPKVKCCFCGRAEVNPTEWGVMLKLDTIVAHHFCLLFSAVLEQHGEDNEGMFAFLPADIKKEMHRGRRLRCKFCKKTGATIGCAIKQCPQSYHYPCGYEHKSSFQFHDQFTSYCVKHKKTQVIPEGTSRECPICMSEVDDEQMTDAVWPPCCGKQMFHRRCIMATAKAAGYFFKCPLCNSKDHVFINAMKENGVFVPEQDAAWEREPNAFQELLTSYSRCDALKCLCPEGREFTPKTEESGATRWELLRCHYCASSATHLGCSKIKRSKWKCTGCRNLFKKPAVQETVTRKPVVSEEVTKELVVQEEVTRKPVVQEEVTMKPVVQEEVTRKPVVQEEVTRKPLVQETVKTKPVVQETITKKSVVQEEVAKKLVVQETVARKSVLQEKVSRLCDLVDLGDSGDEAEEMKPDIVIDKVISSPDIVIDKVIPGVKRDSGKSAAFRALLQRPGRFSTSSGSSTVLRRIQLDRMRRRSQSAATSPPELICLDDDDTGNIMKEHSDGAENCKRRRL